MPALLVGFFIGAGLWTLLFIIGFAPWVTGYQKYRGRHR